jgi:hypothetical protein
MTDPVSVVKDYDAAWNAHDVEGVLAFFTDDAEVRMEPAPPDDEFGGVYSGKEQIRAGFVEPLMEGFHVDSSNHQVAGAQEGVGESNLDSHGIGRVLQADGSRASGRELC